MVWTDRLTDRLQSNASSIHLMDINLLTTKRRLLYLKIQFVPHCKRFISVIKTNHLALYRETFAICCEINTKHTSIVWFNVKFLNVKPVGATHTK
jgi:hypothetical protein